jgi:NMD protein affecting ribosome stability and mRNA decay
MPYVIVCLNCDIDAENRGRGLCPRCYQYLWRTGRLPWPNLTTVEEVLGEVPHVA